MSSPPGAATVVADVCGVSVCVGNTPTVFREILIGGSVDTKTLIALLTATDLGYATRHRSLRESLRRADYCLPLGKTIELAIRLLSGRIRPAPTEYETFAHLLRACKLGALRIDLITDSTVAYEELPFCTESGKAVVGVRHRRVSSVSECLDLEGAASSFSDDPAEILLVLSNAPNHHDRAFSLASLHAGRILISSSQGEEQATSPKATSSAESNQVAGNKAVYPSVSFHGKLSQRWHDAVFLVRALGYRARIVKGLYARDGWSRGIETPVIPSERAREDDDADHGHRAVLFATPSLGQGSLARLGLPIALMPLGRQPAIDFTLEMLALAGCMRVDLVLCDSPELIRERVGDGRRWGCNVTIHVVSDPKTPYGVFRGILDRNSEPVLVGHIDQLPIISKELLALPPAWSVGEQFDTGSWLGWAKLSSEVLTEVEPDTTFEALTKIVALNTDRSIAELVSEKISLTTPKSLLAAQQTILRNSKATQRTHGASENVIIGSGTSVAPSARLLPGTLIGDSCFIGANASVGPNVVIGDQVVIEKGVSIRDSLVIGATYVAPDLDIRDAILTGETMISTESDVVLEFSQQDFLIGGLGRPADRTQRSLIGQFVARTLALALSPFFVIALIWNKRRTGEFDWPLYEVINGAEVNVSRVGSPRTASRLGLIRMGSGNSNLKPNFPSLLPALLDLSEGRRIWFGPAPIDSEQIKQVSDVWQSMLRSNPAGVLSGSLLLPKHMSTVEEKVVADLYQIVRSSFVERVKLVKIMMRHFPMGIR